MAQNLNTVLRIIAKDETKGALSRTRKEMIGISDSLSTIRNQALALAGINFGLGGLAQLAATADNYQLLTARLQVLSGETENFAELQTKVFQIAQDTFSSYDQIVQIYGNLAASTQEVGLSQEQLLTVTQALSEAYIVSGATQQEARASTIQLVQALASGQLRGQEFNSVAEQGRRILFALKDATGLTAGELRQFANEGKLTTEFFINNFLPQAEAINEEFQQLPLTVARSLTNLQNAFLQTVGRINQEQGVTLAIASTIQSLAFNFDDAADTIITAGGALVAFLTGRFAAAQAQALAGSLANAQAARLEAVAERQKAVAKAAGLTQTVAALRLEEESLRRRALAAFRYNATIQERNVLETRLAAITRARIAQEAQLATATNAVAAATTRASLASGAWAATLGVFGGPIGLAVTGVIALGAGIAYLDNQVTTGLEAYNKFAESLEKTSEAAEDAEDDILNTADAMERLENSARFAEIQLGRTAIAALKADIADLNDEIERLQERNETGSTFGGVTLGVAEINLDNLKNKLTETQKQLEEREETLRKILEDERELNEELDESSGVSGVPRRLIDALEEQEDANDKLKDIEKERRSLLESLNELSDELSGPGLDFETQTSAFNITALNRLRDEIQGDLDRGDARGAIENIEKARQAIEALKGQKGVSDSFLKTQLDLLKDLAEEAGDLEIDKIQPPEIDKETAATNLNEYKKLQQDFLDQNPGKSFVVTDLESGLASLNRVMAALQERANQGIFVPVRSGDTSAPEAQANATGGRIVGPGGPTSDSILSWLSNGEYVIRAAAAKHYGYDILDRLNSMTLPRYAQGGAVRSASIAGTAQGAPIIFNINGQTVEATVSGSQVGDLRAALRRENMKRGSRA